MLQRLGYKISKWNGNAEKKQATARRERKGNKRADNEKKEGEKWNER